MNQADLEAKIAEITGKSKAEANRFVSAFMSVVSSTVVDKREDVFLSNFGRFTLSLHKARTVRNPNTKELVLKPAVYFPRFAPGKKFKESAAKLATPSETGVGTAADGS